MDLKSITKYWKTFQYRIILFLFLYSGTTYVESIIAQELKTPLITLRVKNESVKQVFEQLSRQTNYKFFYDNSVLEETGKISLDVKKQDINKILEIITQETGLIFKRVDNTISVNIAEKNVSQTPVSSIKIRGHVSDHTGESLIGVTIKLRWGDQVVVTDIDGNFSIDVPYANAALEFSYIGYKTKEIALEGKNMIRVVLDEDIALLEEIVVVGYGTLKKESVIGSITTLKPGKLELNQTRALSNNLAGQMAGIIGYQRSGEPGSDDSDFWIRGVSTFGANKNPLVLIDGIERDINNISSEEIESFSILKDATATAVYGVRGANGAVLIKTKRGSAGKPKIVIKGDYGISAPVQLPDFVDGIKYMEVLNTARALSGFDQPAYTQEQIERTRTSYDTDLYPNVNWLNTVTRDLASNSRSSADISGGGDRLRYSFIVSAFTEKGIIETDPAMAYDSELKLQRYNVRSNIDMDLTSSTLLNISIGGYIYNRNSPGEKVSLILDQAFQTPPIVHPPVYSSGEYPKITNRTNPWAQTTQRGYKKEYRNSIQSLVSLEQDMGKLWAPLAGLQIKTAFSFDAYSWHNMSRNKDITYYYATGRDTNGKLILSLISEGQEFLDYKKESGGNRNMYFELPIYYDKSFDKNNINALLLYNLSDYINEDAENAIESFPYRRQGLAGRMSYNFDYRYFAEFNFGYNGSENFKKGYRYGFFPSLALGWMISNEYFMKNYKSIINKLKIRGSWGQVGNDELGGRRFAYVTTIDETEGYAFGWDKQWKLNGWQEGDLGINDLTWETATKINLGLELGLFDVFNLQMDVFKELRSNIFMQRKTIPEIAGYNKAPWANYGKVENKGVDASIEYNKQWGKDLQLSLMGNFTYATNKIKEYDEPISVLGTSRSKTNVSISRDFGLIAERLFEESDFSDPVNGILKDEVPNHTFGPVKPGDIKYIDQNNDGKIDSYDECPIGKPHIPEIVYGFGFSLKYKKIDFGAFFQGMAETNFIISGNNFIPGSGGGARGNILTNADDRWTPENPSSDVFWPRLSFSNNENNNRYSTWWQKDGSFLRLKNLEIGYTIYQKARNKSGLEHARIFARGSNLLTFTSFKLWDPELSSSGYVGYPLSRIVSLGFDISF